jgi:polysaccharide chain length determinant protein (PEP-CTERM system associated)
MQEILRLAFTILNGIWRYRWIALIVAVIACPIGWFHVATLPDQYRSVARVYVETDSVLAPLISGLVVETDDKRRIGMMTKILFSRENMEKLARMTDLDLRAKTPQQMDVLVAELKRRVSLRGRGDNIYQIAYDDTSPELTKRVVQSMLTIFVESNLGSAREAQDSAEQFLLREIKDYERRIVEADRKLKDFKLRNLDFVTEKGNYYQLLKSTKDAYIQSQEQLALAQKRVEEMAGQMEVVEEESGDIQEEEYQQWLAEAVTEVTGPHDARIREVEAQIDEMLLKYTELHPEISALNSTLGRLKERRAAARAEFIAAQSGAKSLGDFANPLYQEMRLRLAEAEAEVATQEARVESFSDKTNELQRAVDHILQLEAERQQLTRDRGILGDNHGALVKRLEKARLTREVDSSADSIRFRTLDPPKVPQKPSGPNRIALSTSVFAAALAAGIGIAFVISLLRPVFSDRRQLNEAVGIPVLGSVNMIWTPKQKRKHHIVNLAFAIGFIGLLGAYALVLTVFTLDIDVLSRLPI